MQDRTLHLTAPNFSIASCQASLITPDGGFSASKILKEFYAPHADFFDATPMSLPIPDEAPAEIPRVILKTSNQEWKCQFSPARADIVWARPKTAKTEITLRQFYRTVEDVLLIYVGIATRIARIGTIATRYSEHPTPSLFLARHFCKERWDAAPLDRPANFELHAHKCFTLAKEFQVNSWARSKSGFLTEESAPRPIVLFEQDINTVAEGLPDKAYQTDEIKRFFGAVASEAETILNLYYPGDK